MPEDALERLTKRTRPAVPSRDASLANVPTQPTSPDVEIPRLRSKEEETSNLSAPTSPASPGISTPRNPDFYHDEIVTKQTTMRLEQTVSDRIQDLSRSHNISREVLIEALLLHCESDPKTMDSVITAAQARHDRRLQAANRKRAQTMIEKFG